MLRIISVKATLLLLFCYSPLIGQNLESIGKEKPLVITGGVSLSQIVYTSSVAMTTPAIDREKKTITLRWSYALSEAVAYRVYRKKNYEGM